MNKAIKKYYAKIILFGEYTVLSGSDVLTIPFRKYGGRLTFNPDLKTVNKAVRESSASLKTFLSYLVNSKAAGYLDLEKLSGDLDRGLYFDSDIPEGYGLGSSGALVAAVFNAYGTPQAKRLEEGGTLEVLSWMESCFHGTSSGIDPVSSWLGEALIIRAGKSLSRVGLPDWKSAPAPEIFLVDTGIKAATGPLIELFREKLKDPGFSNRVGNEWLPSVKNSIDYFLTKEEKGFYQAVEKLSAIQLEMIPEMIPSGFRADWENGISSGHYLLKLCGSGGGGFLLGITRDFDRIAGEGIFRKYPVMRIF